MATNDEILFGRIAVLSKFVTQEHVDECIALQEARAAEGREDQPLHLGTLLVERGHLTEREKRAILQVQKENLQRREAGTNARRQERIFGFLVMKLGYCTEPQVFECVREQAKLMRLNLIFKLGEVFVSKEYLTLDQVDEVLALQDKFIVDCEGCKTKFNVVRYQAGSKVKCPECSTVIEVPDILGEATGRRKTKAQAKAALIEQNEPTGDDEAPDPSEDTDADDGESEERESDEGDADDGESEERASDEGDADDGESEERESDEGDADDGESEERESDEGDADDGESEESGSEGETADVSDEAAVGAADEGAAPKGSPDVC